MEERSEPRGLSTTSRDSVSEHNLQHKKPPLINTNPDSPSVAGQFSYRMSSPSGVTTRPTCGEGQCDCIIEMKSNQILKHVSRQKR
jgi:hypothetical protein